MKFLSAVGTLLLLTPIASADYFIGYSNFNDASFGPDVNETSLDSTISGGLSNVTGSTTGKYGGDPLQPAPTNDGRINLANEMGSQTYNVTLTVENDTAGGIGLAGLVFDKRKGGLGTAANFSISYQIDGGTSTPIATQTVSGLTWSPTTLDFQDLLGGKLLIPAGSVLTFLFSQAVSQGTQVRLDNIGILVVPEPGSFLALGGLVATGAFFRHRRREDGGRGSMLA